MKKTFYLTAWFTIFSTMAIIFIVVYWLVAPYEVLTFYGNNTELTETTVENTVKSGEYLPVRENYCKNMAFPSTISRTFIDGISYQVPVFVSNRPVGCRESIEYIYIPKAIPPGKYRIETVYSFQVNPLRTVHFTLTTDLFTVE